MTVGVTGPEEADGDGREGEWEGDKLKPEEEAEGAAATVGAVEEGKSKKEGSRGVLAAVVESEGGIGGSTGGGGRIGDRESSVEEDESEGAGKEARKGGPEG